MLRIKIKNKLSQFPQQGIRVQNVSAARDQSSECSRNKGSEFRMFPQQGIRDQNVSSSRSSEQFLKQGIRDQYVPATRDQSSECFLNKGSEFRVFPQHGIRDQNTFATGANYSLYDKVTLQLKEGRYFVVTYCRARSYSHAGGEERTAAGSYKNLTLRCRKQPAALN